MNVRGRNCKILPSRSKPEGSVGGKLLEISNVAKDLRSTAESKLDVLFAVWFGKKGSSGLSGLQRPHLIEQERS